MKSKRKAEPVRIYGSGFDCHAIAIVDENVDNITLLCDVFMLKSVCKDEADRINGELAAAEDAGEPYILNEYATTPEA